MQQADSFINGPRPPPDAALDEADGPPPAFVPDHQLLRRIGRGSYGEVWLARSSLGTYRAVKVVYRNSFKDQRPFEREWSGIRKYEPVSRSHEGLVQVLHVGINEQHGCFYYVMEVADDRDAGQSIQPPTYVPRTLAEDLARRRRVSAHECLKLGLGLTRALAQLHQHGLVHRDIKPSNIIFINGTPKLADIGLVAETSEARSYVGTEGFIAPEGPGSRQADVYSLGKVLYEASTGKDRQEFPKLPTGFEAMPDQAEFLELNEIVTRACRHDPRDRYQTAQQMHDELLLLANGRSVRRLHLLERRLSVLKRVGGMVLLVLLLGGALGYQVYREQRARRDVRLRQVGAMLANGTQALKDGDLLGALPSFAEALRLDRTPAAQAGYRLRLGASLAQCPKLTGFWSELLPCKYAEFSRDGARIVIPQYRGLVSIRDLATGSLCVPPFGPNQLVCASLHPDGRLLVTGDEGGDACIWDTAKLAVLRRLPHPGAVNSARFNADGRLILTACDDGVVRLWDSQSGQLVRQLPPHREGCLFANFSHDEKLIATASKDGTARLFQTDTGAAVSPALPHKSWVACVAFSPDDHLLLTASFDRKVRLWDVASGRKVPVELDHSDGVQSAAFSPDGRWILTACLDGTVKFWEADSLRPLALNAILRQGERATWACFDPDGRRVLVTCADGSVRLFDLAGAAPPPSLAPGVLSLDGTRLLTVTNRLQVWDSLTGALVSAPLERADLADAKELSRDGRFLVTQHPLESENACRFQVWETATGQPAGPALLVSNASAKAVLSDDGRKLLTFGDAEVQLWSVSSAAALSAPLAHPAPVRLVSFDRPGLRFASVSGDQVRVWDASDGRSMFTLTQPQDVMHAEFSPNGLYLVTCCSDLQLTKCCAQVWNAATGQPVGPPLRHGDGVLWAAFSPDSRRVVTASEDFTARVWDSTTGRQIGRSFEHPDQVLNAGFSPDGKWIVTACLDRRVRVWDADTGDPLTPSISLPYLLDATFLADSRQVAAVAGDSVAVWPLALEQRPSADLASVAFVLTGGSVTPAVEATPARVEPPFVLWQRLRARYPRAFAVSSEESRAWHDAQAAISARQGDWFASAFHLKRLLASRPNDPVLQQRLAQALQALQQKQ